MFKSNSLLCFICVEAMARLAGPTAGKGGSMEACGPIESRSVVRGKTVATLTTDIPGKITYSTTQYSGI